MNILVTGANGFVGKNLVCALKNLRDGKDCTRPELSIDEIYEADRNTTQEQLHDYCRKADFVFHLAGVNRPKDTAEFMAGNCGITKTLLDTLSACGNTCPVMLASSAQASQEGRYAGSEYGKSKLAAEKLLCRYAADTGAKTLVYRFPNLFGKWCRPNYNSAVATFCYNIAYDLPIQVNNPATELELVYIDDLVAELLDALEGKEHHNGQFCTVPISHHATLETIVDLLREFQNQPHTLVLPEIPVGSFAKKLYSTYLSYLPKERIAFPLKMNTDNRGSFTELLKTRNAGQFSVNISRPGITKGQHWHNSKWEFFMVVSGHGLIQERKIGTDEVLEFEVSGEQIEAVHMLPGDTHNIINLSDTENLATLMWANESFDPAHPDTYHEEV